MTQLTLNIENPAVLPSLKKLLAFVDGVSVAHEKRAQTEDVEQKALRSALRQVKRIQAGRIEVRPVEDLLNEY